MYVCTDVAAPASGADRAAGRVRFSLWRPEAARLETHHDAVWPRIPSRPYEASQAFVEARAQEILARMRHHFGDSPGFGMEALRFGFGPGLPRPQAYWILALQHPYLTATQLAGHLPKRFQATHPLATARQYLRRRFRVPWHYVNIDAEGHVQPTRVPVPMAVFEAAKVISLDIETENWQYIGYDRALLRKKKSELQDELRAWLATCGEAGEAVLELYTKGELIRHLTRLKNKHKQPRVTTAAVVTDSPHFGHRLLIDEDIGPAAAYALGGREYVAPATVAPSQEAFGAALTQIFADYDAWTDEGASGPVLFVTGHFPAHFDLPTLGEATGTFTPDVRAHGPIFGGKHTGRVYQRYGLEGRLVLGGEAARLDTANRKLDSVFEELTDLSAPKLTTHAALSGLAAADRARYCLQDTAKSYLNFLRIRAPCLLLASMFHASTDALTSAWDELDFHFWNRRHLARFGYNLEPPEGGRELRDTFRLEDLLEDLMGRAAPRRWAPQVGYYPHVRVMKLTPGVAALKETLLAAPEVQAVYAAFRAETDPVTRLILANGLNALTMYPLLRLREITGPRLAETADLYEDARYTREFSPLDEAADRGLSGHHQSRFLTSLAWLWARLPGAAVLNFYQNLLFVEEDASFSRHADLVADLEAGDLGFERARGQLLSLERGRVAMYFANAGKALQKRRGYGFEAYHTKRSDFPFVAKTLDAIFEALFTTGIADAANVRAALAAAQAAAHRFWRGDVEASALQFTKRAARSYFSYSGRTSYKYVGDLTRQRVLAGEELDIAPPTDQLGRDFFGADGFFTRLAGSICPVPRGARALHAALLAPGGDAGIIEQLLWHRALYDTPKTARRR